MRRIGTWGCLVVLLLGLAATASLRAADPPPDDDEDRPPPKQGWHLAPWIEQQRPPAPPPKPAPKKPATQAKTEAPKSEPPARPVSASERAMVRRQRAEQDFLRRLAVCDALNRIAQENRDADLERRAQLLHERAWAIYTAHTVQLPYGGSQYAGDEGTLERYLGNGPAPSPTALTNPARSDRDSRAAVGGSRP
jgi:hypothetical protein